jgi:PAS domain S-box-containing protein
MAFRLFEAQKSLNRKNMEFEATNEELRVALEDLDRTNTELGLSEDKFSKAFRMNPDCVHINRFSDGVYLDVNEGFTHVLGYSKEDVIGRSSLPGELGIWVNENDREYLIGILSEKGEVQNLEGQLRRKNGSIATVSTSARIIEIEGEKCILSITRDITDRKNIENTLLESEKRFRAAFEDAPVGISLTALDGRLRMVNHAFCEMLGRSTIEVNSSDFSGLTHPDDRAASLEQARLMIEGRADNGRFTKRYLHKDGHEVWADVSISLVKDEQGRPDYFITHILDVTSQKAAETLLQRTQVLLKSSIESPKDIIILSIDKDFNYLCFNCAYHDDMSNRYGIDVKVGMNLLKCIPADSFRERSIPFYRRAFKGESNRVIERSEADNSFYESFYNPIIDDRGEIIGATAFSMDITQQRSTSSLLSESENRWRTMISASPDGIAVLTLDDTILYASPRCVAMFGYESPEAQIGQSFHRLLDPSCHAKAEALLQGIREGKRARNEEYLAQRKDGSTFFTEINSEVVKGDEASSDRVILVIRDITDRKRREEEIRQNQRRYENLLATMGEGFCYQDEHEVFRFANQAAEQIFGVQPATLVGRSVLDFLDEEGKAKLESEKARRQQGQSSTYLTPIIRADGRRRCLRVSAAPVGESEEPFVGSSIVFSDVTEQLKAEEALTRLAKHREVLLRELQHRVKNSLNIVSSLLDLARRELSDPKSASVLTDASTRIDSMSLIYEQLNFAEDLETIAFDQYLVNLAQTIYVTFNVDKDRIRLATQVQSVRLDAKRAITLGLILNELLTNALKYAFPSPNSGTINVDLHCSDGKIVLSVSDDGVGLPTSTLPETATTMGMMLIRLLVQQIEGVLAVGTDKGTSLSVSFNLHE